MQRLGPKQRFAFAACLALASAHASANGRFPETNQLVVAPENPDHMVVRATYGILVTKDRGSTWGLLCEDAFGPQNTDPPVALLPGGVMLIALDDRISRSDELGCSFGTAQGIGADSLTAPVVDVSASLAEPGAAFAATQGEDGASFWFSGDFGSTFSRTSEPLTGFAVVTLDVAPSDPERLYASGLVGSTGVLLRSENRGQTFERFEIPGASGSKVPYIAAVDPGDADTLYVRTYGIPGSLLQTRDGGASFAPPFRTELPLQGFALSKDGGTVVVSNPFEGTFVAGRDGFEFEKLRCGGPSCLGFAESELFGCGNESLDGFIVGVSRDLGATFTRVLAQSCIAGPVECPADSGAGAVCPGVWPALEAELGAQTCAPLDVEPDASCFEAGGAAGSENGGASPAGGAPSSAGAPEGGAAEAGRARRSPDDSGCSVRSVSGPRRDDWVCFGACLALALGVRRRARAALGS